MTWKKIWRNENYSINENGEIRNDLTGKTRKAHVNKHNGHLYVDLWKDNKSSVCKNSSVIVSRRDLK